MTFRVIIKTQTNFFDLSFLFKKHGEAMPLEIRNFGGCRRALAFLASILLGK